MATEAQGELAGGQPVSYADLDFSASTGIGPNTTAPTVTTVTFTGIWFMPLSETLRYWRGPRIALIAEAVRAFNREVAPCPG